MKLRNLNRSLAIATVILSLAAVETAANPMLPPGEREALIALYQLTGGDQWFVATNWRNPQGTDFNAPGTECTWYGVTCNAEPAVIGIDLDNNNLSGPLPIEIANLKSLTFLRLTSNRLTGSIPSEFGTLLDLEWLWLSSNQLTGPIPNELGLMYSLYWLKVNDNQISGSIPPELGYLESLEYLGLARNHLSGSIPPEIGNLSGLAQLELDANALTGSIPENVTNLTELKDGSGLCSRWNGLHTMDPSVDAFLSQKHDYWGDWHASQTVPPGDVEVSSIRNFTAWLTWPVASDPDLPGGYEVFFAPTGSEEWISAGWTSDKTQTTFPVTGLDPETTYDFAVMEFTTPHEQNPNSVDSDLSAPYMATTAALSCERPSLVVETIADQPLKLSVEGSFDSFSWSTGDTGAEIELTSADPSGWYWVNVTSPGSCEETAAVYVDTSNISDDSIFSDGFETGDLSAWS